MSGMMRRRAGALKESGRSLPFPASRDTTARPVVRRSPDTLLDGESLQQMVDALPAEVAVVDEHWHIVAANAAWLDAAMRSGLGALVGIGGNYRRLCEWSLMSGIEDGEKILKAMDAIDEGRMRQFLHTYRSPLDGQYFHISIALFDAPGARYATVSRLNMTELFELRRQRLHLSASLMKAQASLMRAQEEERQRVARELHDTAAQHLVGISLGLARLHQASSDPIVTSVANELSGLLEQFHRDVRGLTYLLHPPQLRHCGLHAAVQSLCTGFAARTGLDIQLRIYGEDRMRGSAVEATAYRIIQEALSNIHKHAHATCARVRLSDRPEALFVTIDDDGVGLTAALDHACSDLAALGVGVPGMIARVDELGGRFAIRTRPNGRGTAVAAVLPRAGAAPDFVVDPEVAELAELQRGQRNHANDAGGAR